MTICMRAADLGQFTTYPEMDANLPVILNGEGRACAGSVTSKRTSSAYKLIYDVTYLNAWKCGFSTD